MITFLTLFHYLISILQYFLRLQVENRYVIMIKKIKNQFDKNENAE